MECLNQADSLVHRATDWEVIDGDLAEDTLGVNKEEATKSNALVLNQDVIGLSNRVVGVRDQRELEVRSEASLAPRLRSPGEVRVLGIRGGSCATINPLSQVSVHA